VGLASLKETKHMLIWHLFCYRYEALHAVTIEDAISVMRHERQTGAFLFGKRL
jgi:hypothetical protein